MLTTQKVTLINLIRPFLLLTGNRIQKLTQVNSKTKRSPAATASGTYLREENATRKVSL